MTPQPRTNGPNVLLLVRENCAANLLECDDEIATLQKKLEDAIARREALRAIARAAGVTLDATPEAPVND